MKTSVTSKEEILSMAKSLQPAIVANRRYLHARPELSFHEHETAAFAADKLEALGYRTKRGVGGTGVIADLGEGKTVVIRSDMDALPGFESNRTDYVSQVDGAMHACGHDAHVACVLAAAEILAATKPTGRVRILMQPGVEVVDSEGHTGATYMIEAGIMQGVDALVGLHVDATLASGHAGIIATPLSTLVSGFLIRVRAQSFDSGKVQDVLPTAISIMQDLYQLARTSSTASNTNPLTVGSCRSSSTQGEVFSDEVFIRGTVSGYTDGECITLIDKIEKLAAAHSSDDVSITLESEPLNRPSTRSTPLIEALRQSAIDMVGPDKVESINRKSWTADFALLAEHAPAAFIYLGVGIPGSRRVHHDRSFDLNETDLYLGAAILANFVHRCFSQS